jgi:hypothetical protein
MTRLATSFVLGFHGCDARIAERAVMHGADILQSDKDYDWLGPGAYFWESDPQRAYEWAQWKATRGDYRHPTVIGAVIDLRNCFDLVARENIELIQAAHASFLRANAASGLPLPRNISPRGMKDADRILRFLDCAVFRHLHEIVRKLSESDPTIEAFDTVRGMFVEGGKAYPGSGIHQKNHVQIAVRNPVCIKGVFYERAYRA